MPERILPGVTIDVKDEGLITTNAGATNVIGMIGTASWGTIGEVITLSSFAEADSTFKSDSTNLTLRKALELAYSNGASVVRCIRIATGSAAYATKNLLNGVTTCITLNGKYKGSYGNNISVTVLANGSNVDVKITDGVSIENYTNMATNTAIVSAITAQSSLVTATLVAATPLISAASASNLLSGNDGDGVTNSDYIGGLSLLETVEVNFVLCAGQSADALHSSMNAHCQNMAEVGKERIAIAGAALAESIATIKARTTKSDRFVFIAPGITTVDTAGNEVTRSGAYAASAVAGLLASVDVQTSITNKTLSVVNVETQYTDANLKDLLQDNRCPLRLKQGVRVARGLTTSTNSAWAQITTRRIVDYVKEGTRNAGEQFIGNLNNPRVRSALKGVIETFLKDQVDVEMLTAYTVEVTATRSDEIQGVCKVSMMIQPTFSIDFIEVTIYLQ